MDATLLALLSPETRRLYDEQVAPLLSLFPQIDRLDDLLEDLRRARRALKGLQEKLAAKQACLAEFERDRGSSRRRQQAGSVQTIKTQIQEVRRKIAAADATIQTREAAVEAQPAVVCEEEQRLQATTSVVLRPLYKPPQPAQAQQQPTVAGQASNPRAAATTIATLFEHADAASQVLECVSMKCGLTGIGTASRDLKQLTEASLPVVTLRYKSSIPAPPLSRYGRLLHLRIDNCCAARSLEGLEAVSANLRSLAICINSKPTAAAIDACSFEQLKYLWVQEPPERYYSCKLAKPGTLPRLESLQVDGAYPYDPRQLHEIVVTNNCYPNLRRLNFEASHVLCGGQPTYMGMGSVTMDTLRRARDTSAIEIRPNSLANLEAVLRDDVGLPSLRYLRTSSRFTAADLSRLADSWCWDTVEELDLTTTEAQRRYYWQPVPQPPQVPAGALASLRRLSVGSFPERLEPLLLGCTSRLESLALDRSSTLQFLASLGSSTFVPPWLPSLKRLVVMFTQLWEPPFKDCEDARIGSRLCEGLRRLPGLEELDVFLQAAGRMDDFIPRLLQLKESNGLPCLKTLKLRHTHVSRSNDKNPYSSGACSLPMALLLLAWLQRERDAQATRGFSLPYLPMELRPAAFERLRGAVGPDMGEGLID